MRHLIVNDTAGKWYIRGVHVVTHDLERDEKVYRCHVPAGGPYADLATAARELKRILDGRKS